MAEQITYYGFETEEGLQGVFRMRQDDADETLTLERPDSDGVWTDDPELIDELTEPGVRPITEGEALAFLGEAPAPVAPE